MSIKNVMTDRDNSTTDIIIIYSNNINILQAVNILIPLNNLPDKVANWNRI